MTRRKTVAVLLVGCMLALSSCEHPEDAALGVGLLVTAPFILLDRAIDEANREAEAEARREQEQARQAKERWESFPEAYRPLLTSYPAVKENPYWTSDGVPYARRDKAHKDQDIELSALYEPLIRLLQMHPLDDNDGERSANVLRELLYIAQAVKATIVNSSDPRLETMMDDSEYFLKRSRPVNPVIADTILRGLIEWQSLYYYIANNTFKYNIIFNLPDPQGQRLANLIIDDAALLYPESRHDERGVRLYMALKIAPGLPEYRAVKSQLDQIMRACVFSDDECAAEFKRYAFQDIMYASESEKQRLALFKQAAGFSWMRQELVLDFHGDRNREFFFLLSLFTGYENKMAAINKFVQATPPANLLYPDFRGVFYYLWAQEKDRRWLTAVRKIIREALEQEQGPYVFDVKLIDSEIALLQGDLEKGLSLRAQYLAENARYMENTYDPEEGMFGQREVPFSRFAPGYHWQIDYLWPHAMTFYINDGARQTSAEGPNDVLKFFYSSVKEIYNEGPAGGGLQQAFYQDIHPIYDKSSGDVHLKQAFMEAARIMARGR